MKIQKQKPRPRLLIIINKENKIYMPPEFHYRIDKIILKINKHLATHLAANGFRINALQKNMNMQGDIYYQ
jgi:hypothetical protein